MKTAHLHADADGFWRQEIVLHHSSGMASFSVENANWLMEKKSGWTDGYICVYYINVAIYRTSLLHGIACSTFL